MSGIRRASYALLFTVSLRRLLPFCEAVMNHKPQNARRPAQACAAYQRLIVDTLKGRSFALKAHKALYCLPVNTIAKPDTLCVLFPVFLICLPVFPCLFCLAFDDLLAVCLIYCLFFYYYFLDCAYFCSASLVNGLSFSYACVTGACIPCHAPLMTGNLLEHSSDSIYRTVA